MMIHRKNRRLAQSLALATIAACAPVLVGCHPGADSGEVCLTVTDGNSVETVHCGTRQELVQPYLSTIEAKIHRGTETVNDPAELVLPSGTTFEIGLEFGEITRTLTARNVGYQLLVSSPDDEEVRLYYRWAEDYTHFEAYQQNGSWFIDIDPTISKPERQAMVGRYIIDLLGGRSVLNAEPALDEQGNIEPITCLLIAGAIIAVASIVVVAHGAYVESSGNFSSQSDCLAQGQDWAWNNQFKNDCINHCGGFDPPADCDQYGSKEQITFTCEGGWWGGWSVKAESHGFQCVCPYTGDAVQGASACTDDNGDGSIDGSQSCSDVPSYCECTEEPTQCTKCDDGAWKCNGFLECTSDLDCSGNETCEDGVVAGCGSVCIDLSCDCCSSGT